MACYNWAVTMMLVTILIMTCLHVDGQKTNKHSNKCTSQGGTCKKNCDEGDVVRPKLCNAKKNCCLQDKACIELKGKCKKICRNGTFHNDATLCDGPNERRCCITGAVDFIAEPDDNQCNEAPCQNGGTCSETAWGYSCECDVGYSGPICSQPTNAVSDPVITPCEPSPCEHGATCYSEEDGVKCNCTDGFSGKYCQIGTVLETLEPGYHLDFVNFAEYRGSKHYNLYNGCTATRTTVIRASLIHVRSPKLYVTPNTKFTTFTCSGTDAVAIYDTMSVSVYTVDEDEAADIVTFTGKTYRNSSWKDPLNGLSTKVYVFTLTAAYTKFCTCSDE